MWQKAIIKNLCEITSSKRIYAADYQSDGVPFFRGKEIIEKHKGNLEVSTELFISEDKFLDVKSRFGVPQPGDLLLTSVGTLGVPYVVKPGEKFYFKDGNLTWFRLFKNLDSRYLYYWLISSQGKAQLRKCTIGSSQPAFTIVLLKDMEIQLPPFNVQRQIAGILSAYDDLIENNLRRIKILEEMAQTLYREWFVKFRFPGHQKVKMVHSPIGQMPEGWEIRQIGEVIETLGGGTPSTKEPSYWEGGDIDWYSPSDLTASGSMFITGSSKKITQLGLDKSSAKLFPAYSLMMTSRATIGVVSINTQKACTNQGFITCVPSDRLSVFHLYFWIEESREKIISVASGATFKEISRGEFREFPIVVPPPFIENTFTETVEPMCRLIENLIKKNHNLVVTRDLLLPKLISGKLDVSKMDITIPEAKA